MRPHCVSCAKRPGVEPIDENSCDIDHVGQFYSSEGMTDELANIMVVHLRHWQAVERHFDARRACRICLDPVEAATRHAHHGLQFGDRHFA